VNAYALRNKGAYDIGAVAMCGRDLIGII
jgi:hypothetical protein